MIVSEPNARRFFRIWWALLEHVNRERKLLSKLPRRPGDGAMRLEEAAPLREALWADDALRESFVIENPAGLAPEDLSVVSSWQARVEGKFIVFRYLKRHTVFMDTSSAVYGVLGLYSPIEDLLGPRPPHVVETVLLPFGSRIVTDGILRPLSVRLGPGIRRSLAETYSDAWSDKRIVTSLDGHGHEAIRDASSGEV
jgi:hypothetical protein